MSRGSKGRKSKSDFTLWSKTGRGYGFVKNSVPTAEESKTAMMARARAKKQHTPMTVDDLNRCFPKTKPKLEARD